MNQEQMYLVQTKLPTSDWKEFSEHETPEEAEKMKRFLFLGRPLNCRVRIVKITKVELRAAK